MTEQNLKATHAQFGKLISRSTPLELTPEVKLIISVLIQAWADAIAGKLDAIKFFVDGRAGLYGETIGLDADFIKETFMKHLNFLVHINVGSNLKFLFVIL